MSPNRVWPFFWVFALFLLQNGLFYLFPAKVPAFVLAGVLFYSLSEEPPFGVVIGAWGGFLMDLFGLGRPGFFTAAFAGAGFLSGALSSKIFQDSFLTQIVLPPVSFYGVMLARLWQLKAQTGEPAGLGLFAEAFLPWPLCMTALCSPWLFGRLRALSPRRRRIPSRI